jgi:hypothetical protein
LLKAILANLPALSEAPNPRLDPARKRIKLPLFDNKNAYVIKLRSLSTPQIAKTHLCPGECLGSAVIARFRRRLKTIRTFAASLAFLALVGSSVYAQEQAITTEAHVLGHGQLFRPALKEF